MPRRTPSLRLLALALVAAATVFVTPAAAEMPENRDAPTITEAGGPIVGQLLNGNNGTWLYADGTGCRDECRYSFAWFRCVPGGPCSAIPGGATRAYRVSLADVGRTLRVAVTATKHDCNAIGQDCRLVSRTAASAESAPIAPASPPARLSIAHVGVERATRGRHVVGVRVTDEHGRGAAGARVTIRGARVDVTDASGLARVAVPAGTSLLAIRAERAGAPAATLTVRLPAAR
jgi:hypothetical protein